MSARPPFPSALLQFVDDEMLRAPLLHDQLVEAAIQQAMSGLAGASPMQRGAVADLMQALQTQTHRARMAEYFIRSLREQVAAEMAPQPAKRPADFSAAPPIPKSIAFQMEPPTSLALVDEETVSLDVELAHAIETIRSTAEYELRELQTFISALVGDMDVARDHNPFRAETYARALWDSAHALPLSRGHQVAYMRSAGLALAQLLRRSYSAACSRLESMGVEPASYRTVILPAGSRRGYRSAETTYAPDLYRIRDTMPAPLDTPLPQAGKPLSYDGQQPPPRAAERSLRGEPLAPQQAPSRVDRQAVELVSRLFEAMLADERVPADVSKLISRLQGPAMRLTLRDGSMLDEDKHPLWRLINRLAFEAEMAPDPADPDRVLLLKTAQATVDQLASEAEQNNGLYRWALDRLESFLHKRLTRRLAAAASQIGALQKLEDKLTAGQTTPSTMHGMLDVPQLDTVPAELLEERAATPPPPPANSWLDELRPGDWVRMFLQGRWVQARLLWPGERREIWLFGDGASDSTWAVRRNALLLMHSARLAKTLKQRSIVATAAARVQDQVNDEIAA